MGSVVEASVGSGTLVSLSFFTGLTRFLDSLMCWSPLVTTWGVCISECEKEARNAHSPATFLSKSS